MNQELLDKYYDKFGPLPYWLLQGAEEEYIVEMIQKALAENKPIDEIVDSNAKY